MTYVRHDPCPSCGSRDNLAVYTDHAYCFGCGFIEFFNYHSRRINGVKDTTAKIVSLPEDIVSTIPAIADSWIKKYDLTLRELYEARVVWSEYRQLLIFPYFDDKGHLWGWQGRYFGKDPKHPKWTGKGNFKEQIKVYHPLTGIIENGIILVEDIISCLKISRQFNCICLYGSSIDYNKICKIKPEKTILWLDKDKEKEARLFSLYLNKLGLYSEVRVTDLDPKEYDNITIRKIILNEEKDSKIF